MTPPSVDHKLPTMSEIVAKYTSKVRSVIRNTSRGLRPDKVDDIMQMCWVKIWRALEEGRIEKPSSLEAYIVVTVRHTVLNYRRDEMRRQILGNDAGFVTNSGGDDITLDPLDPDIDDQFVAWSEELSEVLESQMFTDVECQMLTMRREGYSLPEIAAVLQITAVNARSSYYYLIRRLRKVVEMQEA